MYRRKLKEIRHKGRKINVFREVSILQRNRPKSRTVALYEGKVIAIGKDYYDTENKVKKYMKSFAVV